MQLIKMKKETLIINRILYGLLNLKTRSYTQLGIEIGISGVTLNRYITKGTYPSPAYLKILENYLEIPGYILFDKKDIHKRQILSSINPEKIKKYEDNYNYPKNANGFGVRVKKPRFRYPTRGIVRRPILYSLLLANNIKISEFAKEIGVSSRIVDAYIYEDRFPKIETIYNILEYLNYDLIDNLFYTVDFSTRNYKEKTLY